MPYDDDQFFSTEQRLASTCVHRNEPKSEPRRKWVRHKQDA